MEFVANPVFMYLCVALGGIGVAVALPRPRATPQILGALLAVAGLGGAFLALGLKAGADRPGFYFYLFAFIALGSALRVITHPRPVYAALYFILTIISSSALYLMLGAEFMAFALVIIYAGAILITYLFVIMLAEQTPEGQEVGVASEYDRYAREPVVAAAVGFVLLALLSGLMARGVPTLEPGSPVARGEALLGRMPRKVLDAYDRLGLFTDEMGVRRPETADVGSRLDLAARTMRFDLADAERFGGQITKVVESSETERRVEVRAVRGRPMPTIVVKGGQIVAGLPDDLRAENLDGVGFTLIAEHPMALELAGVVLLMAMLGAVVLARKHIEIGEAEKAAAAR